MTTGWNKSPGFIHGKERWTGSSSPAHGNPQHHHRIHLPSSPLPNPPQSSFGLDRRSSPSNLSLVSQLGLALCHLDPSLSGGGGGGGGILSLLTLPTLPLSSASLLLTSASLILASASRFRALSSLFLPVAAAAATGTVLSGPSTPGCRFLTLFTLDRNPSSPLWILCSLSTNPRCTSQFRWSGFFFASRPSS